MKFRYRNKDEMKDSGIDIVGNIPNSWKVGKAQYYFNVYSGGTPSTNKSSYWDGNIPWINSGEVQNGIVKNISKYITESGLKESSTKLIPKNTTLLAMTGSTCGKVGYLTFDSAANQSVMAFTEPKNCNSKFLFYYLLCQNNQVEYFKTGGAQGGINVDNGKKFYVNIPSNIEQEKIAKFLDEKTVEFDSVISKKEALIEKLEEAKKSLISEVVTGKVKVIKTSDGYELVERKQEEMKDSGVEWLGDIPRDWKVKRLRFLGNLQNGISKSSEEFGHGYPFISYGDVYKNIKLPKKASGLVNSTLNDQKIYSVLEGDVFFTRTSETIEEIGIASTCLDTIPEATFAGFLIRFRPKKDNLYKEFSKYYFRCELNRRFFVKEMNLVTRASLSQNLLKNLSVLIPSFDEQVKIAECLDYKIGTIDKLIKINSNQILKLKKAKQSLISEAVTGKIEILE